MASKNIVVVCILLLSVLSGYSKQHKVYGTVMSDVGKPVELCVIKAVNTNYSTYSNEHGIFSLTYDADSSHTLIFFCLGYETQEVRITGDTLRVVLRRKLNKLDEVVVSANNNQGKIIRGILGKKNLKAFGICTGLIGNEWAIFLQADPKRPGELEKIYYYITKEGMPSSRFRAHVYDIDTGYMPGTDLLDSIVILHANEGDEWVSVNVSSRHISVGRSVFVSMEWISGYGNSNVLITSKKFPAQAPFNGQVLAFTEGYYKQSSLVYERKNANTPWRDRLIAGTSKKNILNPMIYATYTYHKR